MNSRTYSWTCKPQCRRHSLLVGTQTQSKAKATITYTAELGSVSCHWAWAPSLLYCTAPAPSRAEHVPTIHSAQIVRRRREVYGTALQHCLLLNKYAIFCSLHNSFPALDERGQWQCAKSHHTKERMTNLSRPISSVSQTTEKSKYKIESQKLPQRTVTSNYNRWKLTTNDA